MDGPETTPGPPGHVGSHEKPEVVPVLEPVRTQVQHNKRVNHLLEGCRHVNISGQLLKE